MRSAVIACTLVALGCTEPPAAEPCDGFTYVPWVREVSFERFPSLNPSFVISTQTGSRSTIMGRLYFGGETLFTYYSPPLQDGDKFYCPQLAGDVTATVGPHVARLTDTQWICDWGRDAALCRVPAFELSLPADYQPTDSELVLADDSTALTFALGASFARRSIRLVGQTEWTFPANQPASIAWSPATQSGDIAVEFRAAIGGQVYRATDISRSDAIITFTIPGAVGVGTLKVTITSSLTLDTFIMSLVSSVEQTITLMP